MLLHRIPLSRCAHRIAIFLVLAGTWCDLAFGQQMSGQQMSGQMTGQVSGVWTGGREGEERFILLNTGRVMKGRVTPNSMGYLVDQHHGKIQLTHNDVRFVVDTLHEAYCRQRDSVVEPTPATHLSLANWCISYQLYDDASEEVRKCLKSDPENAQAKRLLGKLKETIRASSSVEAEKAVPRKTPEGFIAPEVESLGGLSQATGLQFTSRVQPLMLHKCGNASCHGLASTNDFKILSPRVGGRSTRHTAERNLEEIFRRIDTDDVDHSKLLQVLKGPHGGKGPIFSGPNAGAQRKTFESWVKAVVHDKNAEQEAQEREAVQLADRAAKKAKKPTSQVTSAASLEAANPTVLQASYSERDKESSGVSSRNAEPKELQPDANDAAKMARVPTDDFDPELFNRQSGKP